MNTHDVRCVLHEPRAAELKLLAGSMQPNLLALAAYSANLSLNVFKGQSWADWGLVFALLRRTSLGSPQGAAVALVLEQLRSPRDSGYHDVMPDRLLDEALSHPFGLGPTLANLVLEAGS